MDLQKILIETPGAPAAVGPYSQAIVANGFIFCSGQVPIDPQTNALVEGDITAQTRRVLDNLQAVLEAAGSGLHYAVDVTVYLANFHDFSAMNDVYAQYFTETPPARSTIQAGGLSRDILVEIGCIAIVPSSVHSISVIGARESQSHYDLDSDWDI